MRALLLAAVAVGAMASIGTLSTPAEARDYPFCIKGADYLGGLGDCSFDTYEQCRVTASGRMAYCDANPFYGAPDRSRRVYPERPRY